MSGSLPLRSPKRLAALIVVSLAFAALACDGDGSNSNGADSDAPARSLDLATLGNASPGLLRVQGSEGGGQFGVPVSGGHDLDGDGHNDVVLSAMLGDPSGRQNAGYVFVAFGDGTIEGSIDTAMSNPRLLRVLGSAPLEYTGSEVWLDDLTGDGVAELILARQNFTPEPGRTGAGAVTVLIGGTEVADQAATLAPIDLAAPPMGVTLTTLVGGQAFGRLGMWIRTGDVTGDGIADLLIGADQEDTNGDTHSGALYLVRGGAHWLAGGTVDLVDLSTAFPENLAQVRPPAGAVEFHLGATCQVADLDGNGRAEVIAAATVQRAGGVLLAAGAPGGTAHGAGGAINGRVYIAWDDNFDGDWLPAGFSFGLDAAPGATSEIRGRIANISFGEEILGGLDFDDDGNADLFIGDIIGDLTSVRLRSGAGDLIYNAASLRGMPAFSLDAPPPGLVTTTFLGPSVNDIATDTGMQGDFDDDGYPDLAFSSPHGSPYGRTEAGKIHIVHGQSGPWPEEIDLAWGAQPDPMDVRISEVHGVKSFDVLCYSADAGDHDGDGIDDLIVNEMLGDGVLPQDANTGNVLVISGELIRDLP